MDLLLAISEPRTERECEAGDMAMERRRGRFTRQIGRIFQLLPPEVFSNYVGTDDYQAIWQALKSSSKYRGLAIDWLDAMISTHVWEDLTEMNRHAQTLKVQDAYRTSKSIAMKRYISRVQ
jgi:hypothetical protein